MYSVAALEEKTASFFFLVQLTKLEHNLFLDTEKGKIFENLEKNPEHVTLIFATGS